MSQLPRQLLGKEGEDIAADYLKKHGYRIITRNFRSRYGELDIVALHNQTLIFIEVKTRIGNEFGLPEEAVTPRKLREVIKTGEYFKLLHPELPEALRIDVVAIEMSTEGNVEAFRHIPNVTG